VEFGVSEHQERSDIRSNQGATSEDIVLVGANRSLARTLTNKRTKQHNVDKTFRHINNYQKVRINNLKITCTNVESLLNQQ